MIKYTFRFQDYENNVQAVTMQFDCEHDITMGELAHMFRSFASALGYPDALISRWIENEDNDDF